MQRERKSFKKSNDTQSPADSAAINHTTVTLPRKLAFNGSSLFT